MTYQCPQCDSENIQRISLAFSKGSVKNDSGSNILSETIKPPNKRSVNISSAILVISLFAFVISQSSFWVIVALFSFGFILHAVHHNKTIYEEQLREWNQLWICQRCANVFKLGEFN